MSCHSQDGVRHAWIVVFGSFVNNCFIGSHFGCFSLLYPAITSSFQSQYGVSGWIGSFSQAMVYLPAMFYSVAVRRYGCRIVSVIGSIIACIGYLTSSFSPNIPVLYLTYGLIAGTGIGAMFLSTIVIVQQTFSSSSKRALASGLSLSGMAIGVVIMSPLMQYMITNYTWRGAMAIYGALCLHGVAFGLVFIDPHIKPSDGSIAQKIDKTYSTFSNITPQESSRTQLNIEAHSEQVSTSNFLPVKETQNSWVMFDFSIFKDARFLLYGFGTFALNLGMNTFTMHTPSRALTYDIEPELVGFLPTIIAVGNITSRIILSFVANMTCTNRTMQYTAGMGLGAVFIMMSTFSTEFALMAVFCAFVGFCNGTSLTVQPTVLVDLFSVENIVKSQSALNLFIGMAALFTTPFAGFLYDSTLNYNVPFLVNGSIELLGSFVAMVIVCLQLKQPNSQL